MRIVLASVLALVLALATVAGASAQDDLERRVEQARIFVDMTTTDSVMGPMIDAMWPTVTMQLPADLNPEVSDRLKTVFAEEITVALDDVFEDFAATYADTFTLEELMAINKFYMSGPGNKLMAAQGPMMQRMLPTITTRLQQGLPGAIARVIEQAREDGLIEE